MKTGAVPLLGRLLSTDNVDVLIPIVGTLQECASEVSTCVYALTTTVIVIINWLNDVPVCVGSSVHVLAFISWFFGDFQLSDSVLIFLVAWKLLCFLSVYMKQASYVGSRKLFHVAYL